MKEQSVMQMLELIQARMGMAMDAAKIGAIALKDWKKFPTPTPREKELMCDYESTVNKVIERLDEALRILRG